MDFDESVQDMGIGAAVEAANVEAPSSSSAPAWLDPPSLSDVSTTQPSTTTDAPLVSSGLTDTLAQDSSSVYDGPGQGAPSGDMIASRTSYDNDDIAAKARIAQQRVDAVLNGLTPEAIAKMTPQMRADIDRMVAINADYQGAAATQNEKVQEKMAGIHQGELTQLDLRYNGVQGYSGPNDTFLKTVLGALKLK